jgi:hypothetical protein
MGLRRLWRDSRFRHRWMTEQAVTRESAGAGHAPDVTLDEVGVPGQDIGFSSSPIHSRTGIGYATGDPNSSGWAAWSGNSGVG